jgi:hypothetical protein
MKLYQLVETIVGGERTIIVTFARDRGMAEAYMHSEYEPKEGVQFTLEIVEIDPKDSEFDDKVIALAAHLGCSLESISVVRLSDDTYESDDEPGEYRVLTDSEADSAFKEYQESYVKDCILPDCPAAIRYYFDTDRYARDVRTSDGRGPSLASCDSEENEEKVGDERYFIYRVQ